MASSNLTMVRGSSACALEQREISASAPGERICRILRAGVCGTDLQIMRRVRSDAAAVLGHEGLAAVSTGSGTRPVIFNPVDPSVQDRVLGHSYDGIFRQLFLHDQDGPGLVDADAGLVADLAPLVEPLGAVLYGWELLSRVTRTDTVAVWGSGTTAVLAALVGELRGCQMHLVHPREERLRYLSERDLLGSTILRHRPEGLPEVSAAFLCLPREAAPGALTEALDVLAPDGVIDLFGGFGPGDRHTGLPGVDLGAVRRANVCGHPVDGAVTWTRTLAGRKVGLTGHRGTTRRHLEAAQRLLRRSPATFTPLITHVLSLAAAAEVIPAVASGAAVPVGARERVKMVIDPLLPGRAHRPVDPVTKISDLDLT
ncbi:dehydrogenase [Streptomyces sp. NPDC012623]|uniref:dehydrogenase n=1 Tax=unclassified Streptomyces TaxID=2593676 RepID=UPI0036A931B4